MMESCSVELLQVDKATLQLDWYFLDHAFHWHGKAVWCPRIYQTERILNGDDQMTTIII